MHKPMVILDPGHGGLTSFFYDLDNGVRLGDTWEEVERLDPSEKTYFSPAAYRRWKSGELEVEPRFYFQRKGRRITYGDPGDMSPLNPRVCEKDLVLDVARSLHLEIGRALLVRATRDRDGYVADSRRVAYANRMREKHDCPALFLSLHTASSPDPEERGLRIDRTPDMPERLVEPFRLELHRYRERVQDDFPIRSRVSRPEWSTGLEVPAVTVELGFLSHLDDARRLLDRTLRLELARGLAEATLRGLRVPSPSGHRFVERKLPSQPTPALVPGPAR